MNLRIITLSLVAFIAISSCAVKKQSDYDASKPKDYQTRGNITAAGNLTKEAEAGFSQIGKNIIDYMVSLKLALESAETKIGKSSPETLSSVSGEFKTISDNADKTSAQTLEITNLNKKLSEARDNLSTANGKLTSIEADIKTAYDTRDKAVKDVKTVIAERDKAIADKNEASAKLIRWIMASCVLGFVGAIVYAVMVSPKIGGAIATGCAAGVALCFTMDKYGDYIAYGIMGVLAVGAGIAIYQLWLRNRAITEVVHTAEIAKQKLDPQSKKEVFGSGPVPGMAYTVQSSATESLVNKARKGLKHMLEPTI